MRQLLQELDTGRTRLAQVPCPAGGDGLVVIATERSLVSAGTERMLKEFGEASLLSKALKEPARVKQVLSKVGTDGLAPTLAAVRNKLGQPLPLGYCNAGRVLSAPAGSGLQVGDLVASNGPHAEVVAVPRNLVARVPQGVSADQAAFTVLSAVGLQGIRLVAPGLGECVAVSGLGLIGLLTVQMLRAQGCRVLGLDVDGERCALGRRFGAETVHLRSCDDPVAAGLAFSRGRGVDAVIITAATKSSDPVTHAAQMSRKRGRIVLVGVTGLELNRADFYEKELTFQVSCSYGPGRYDPSYEEAGQDYPAGFVRWTEGRNFEAVLDLMASGALDVTSLISHQVPFDEAPRAYEVLTSGESQLGILLQYPQPTDERTATLLRRRVRVAEARGAGTSPVVIGMVGAGSYAAGVLGPALAATGARMKFIASRGGRSAAVTGERCGFEEAGTEAGEVIADPEVNAVVVATRHDSHCRYVCDALAAGKHVFVEKPLVMTRDELARVEAAYAKAHEGGSGPLLMVGFNRRFAPQVVKMRELLSSVAEPKVFVMTVNAGELPPDHWTQSAIQGGGRFVGEGCHFVDLLRHLAASPITEVQAMKMGRTESGALTDDKTTVTLGFADGSFGTVHYLACGSKAFPKERLEVFCAGRVLGLENFRKLTAWGWPGFTKMNLWSQDKGQSACAAAFVAAVEAGGPSPIPFDELVEVAGATMAAAEGAVAAS